MSRSLARIDSTKSDNYVIDEGTPEKTPYREYLAETHRCASPMFSEQEGARGLLLLVHCACACSMAVDVAVTGQTSPGTASFFCSHACTSRS